MNNLLDEYGSQTAVLVAVLPHVRDLALARGGCYRIPLQRAPPKRGAELLAFYQTAVFGSERWAVRYWAPVQQVSIVPRTTILPDEPDHPRAHERYLRFTLGPLASLPHPLPSRRLRRISFIATTLGQLLRAADVAELWRPQEYQDTPEALWGAGLAGRSV